ncbi:MAG: GntR family transcriptional regulator [Pseudomonadota bacterium]
MEPSKLNKSDRPEQPLYRSLATQLRARIGNGDFPVGSLLPTEQELCADYGTSRFTVREALRLLAEDGLVERRQGRGTEVVSATRQARLAQSLSSLSQLYSYAEETHLEIERTMIVVPDEAMALQLGRAPGRQWLLGEGVRRTTSGATICVTQVFINSDFAAIQPALKTLTGAIHQHITEEYGIGPAEVHQTIEVDPATNIVAAQLGVQPGDLTVLVSRRYVGPDDRPIVVSFNWHRAAEFSYKQIIRPD